MDPNQNFRILDGPSFACPYCPRHLRSKGGRKIHIQAIHQAESRPDDLNLYDPPSPIPYSSPLPPTPTPTLTPTPTPTPTPSNFTPPPFDYTPGSPSNYTPSPSSNYVLPPADDVLSPFSDHSSPSLHGVFEFAALNLAPENDLDAAPGMDDPQVPDILSITRAYHLKLDGK